MLSFPGKQDLEDDAAANKRIVEPDNTFREKLQTFRKISEPQPEDSVPKGPKPPLSYKTLIGNNFSQTTTAPTPAMIAEHEVGFLTTLPFKMFGPFWSVWCKMALVEVGVSLPCPCPSSSRLLKTFLNLIIEL